MLRVGLLLLRDLFLWRKRVGDKNNTGQAIPAPLQAGFPTLASLREGSVLIIPVDVVKLLWCDLAQSSTRCDQRRCIVSSTDRQWEKNLFQISPTNSAIDSRDLATVSTVRIVIDECLTARGNALIGEGDHAKPKRSSKVLKRAQSSAKLDKASEKGHQRSF